MRTVQCIFLTALLLFTGCKSSGEKPYTIGMIQITRDALLDNAHEGVLHALKEAGFVDGGNIRIDYQNALGEIANIPLILQKFRQQKVDMVVTNGSPCIVAAIQSIKDIPVVFTVAFHPAQLGVDEIPPNVTGVYDPMVMDDLVALIREVIPHEIVLGVPWNPSEVNSQFAVRELRKSAAKYATPLIEVTVSNSTEALQAAQTLVTKGANALIVAADNTLGSALGAVVKVANENQVPLFVSDPSLVEDGASAGLGIDAFDWGFASGQLAARIIQGEKVENLPIIPLTAQKVHLSPGAAQKQGIVFTPEFIQKADRIFSD